MARIGTSRSRIGFTDIDRGYNAAMARLLGLKSQRVKVGIRGEKGADRPDPDGPTVAEYATFNEFGTDQIPERSFMRSTFDANSDRYAKVMLAELGRIIDGKQEIPKMLGLMGLDVANDIQMGIETGDFTPNAPLTIAMKGSSKPLIDTGRLKNSIDFEVLPPKKDRTSAAQRAGTKLNRKASKLANKASKRVGKTLKRLHKALVGRKRGRSRKGRR